KIIRDNSMLKINASIDINQVQQEQELLLFYSRGQSTISNQRQPMTLNENNQSIENRNLQSPTN
ncbi:unnamed protein product, partial [Rotaria magnacalcarata]